MCIAAAEASLNGSMSKLFFSELLQVDAYLGAVSFSELVTLAYLSKKL